MSDAIFAIILESRSFVIVKIVNLQKGEVMLLNYYFSLENGAEKILLDTSYLIYYLLMLFYFMLMKSPIKKMTTKWCKCVPSPLMLCVVGVLRLCSTYVEIGVVTVGGFLLKVCFMSSLDGLSFFN